MRVINTYQRQEAEMLKRRRDRTHELPETAARRGRAVTCRDAKGHRRQVRVGLVGERVLLVGPGGEAILLLPLQAGRLRAVLRDALLTLDLAGRGDAGER